MLKTDFISIHKLFSESIQFKIPLYQRNYVWNEEDQWEPLWQDIMEISRVNAKIVEAYNYTTHFTGAIVTRQLPVHIGEVPRHEVIDGQQRLTTFQIILCAIADVCHSAKLTDCEDKATEYLTNGGLLNNRHQPDKLRNSDEVYKVLPAKTDINSFKALVDGNVNSARGAIRDAYVFFERKIADYMRMKNDRRAQMIGLTHFFLHSFGVAQIQITIGANSEKIFESVNARGRIINEFDHLRNNMFLKARVSAEDEDEVKALYEKYWQHFEDLYWVKRLGSDNEEMLLSERFLQHFLMAKLGKSSIPHRDLFTVYDREYRAGLSESQGIETEFLELEKYSKIYRVMLDCRYVSETCAKFGQGYSARRMQLLAERMEFYKILNIEDLHPFILYIINELSIEYNDLDKIFDILESYTIRCLLAGSRGVRNHNVVFAEFIKSISGSNLKSTELLDYLSTLQGNDRCPDDEVFQSALARCGGTYFSALLTRYILYRIELAKTDPYKISELRFGEHLTLEHVMPIKWQRSWPLPNPQNSGLVPQRNSAKQSIGNLTLLTEESNHHLANQRFPEKRNLLKKSGLKLDQEIVYESLNPEKERENWDVAEIREREKALSKCVSEEIWPFMPIYSGELKQWHPNFKNGFIIEAHGEEIPVEASEFNLSDLPLLRKGTKVKYERVPIEGGFKAVNVVPA